MKPPTRAFFIECSGEIWLSIGSICAERHGWEPVYWTGDAGDLAAIRSRFQGCIVHAGTDAALGRAAPGLEIAEPALDTDMLEALAVHESIALHMMERMDLHGSFTHEERRRHWYDLVRYWLGMLNQLKPDVIVFSISPHIVYDYVLYALAKHLNVPTLMFERLGLPGYVYPTRDIEGYPARWKGSSDRPLSPPFETYHRKACEGGVAAVPVNFQRKLARLGLGSGRSSSVGRTLLHELKRAAYLLKRYGLGPVGRSYVKVAGRSPSRSRAGVFGITSARLRSIIAKALLKRYMARWARPAEPGQDYVLLALHYQPERATVPMGHVFGDQTLIVDMLAKALPDGWQLYVKEHPWQLQPSGRPELQRSRDFYDRLCRYPNVRLMPLESDTSALVETARAVATVTGSVGWQALARGKPALVFGAAWYRDCPGALRIRKSKDLEDAFAAITGAFAIPQDDVRRFLSAVEEVCVPGVLEPDVEAVEGLDIGLAAEAMAAALVAELEARLPETR